MDQYKPNFPKFKPSQCFLLRLYVQYVLKYETLQLSDIVIFNTYMYIACIKFHICLFIRTYCKNFVRGHFILYLFFLSLPKANLSERREAGINGYP